MADLSSELFKHNLWANLGLLDACQRLDDTQLGHTVVGTYGSIRDTWVHLVAAEGRYVARLNEQDPDRSFGERTGFTNWDDLRQRAQASGEALIAIAATFDASRILRGDYNGTPFVLPAVVPMIQAINHATEHRVQIATLLTQLGVEPPALDGWQYADDVLGSQ